MNNHRVPVRGSNQTKKQVIAPYRKQIFYKIYQIFFEAQLELFLYCKYSGGYFQDIDLKIE